MISHNGKMQLIASHFPTEIKIMSDTTKAVASADEAVFLAEAEAAPAPYPQKDNRVDILLKTELIFYSIVLYVKSCSHWVDRTV